jgi:N-acetylneuraminic acid mutarotase
VAGRSRSVENAAIPRERVAHHRSGTACDRSGHLAIWTGDELVVWGGWLTDFNRERYDGAGAAYDPGSDTWRMAPRGPLPVGYDAKGAWTGKEVLVMSTPMGIDPEDYPKFDELAAYDPASDSWRELSRPPQVSSVGPPITFVDDKLAVLSLMGTVDGGEVNNYGKELEAGGIYDYSSDRWSAHADPPKRPRQT